MIREENILATGISPKIEHLFSSKKHKIFRAYERQTVQTYLTKIIIAKDQRVFKLYKQHIANNILPYLVSMKYLNHSSFLSLEQEFGQATVRTQYQKQNDQFDGYNGDQEVTNKQVLVHKEKDSSTIIISKKMIKGLTLRQMILNKDKRLTEDFCLDLVAEIVDFLLMGNGVKDMFITTENIIVEDTGFIHFNYFSLVGLQFIKQDKYITKVQFDQLLPYLTPSLMKSKNYIDLQVELRFILINFLSAYFKRDIIFGPGLFDLEVQVKKDTTLLKVVQRATDSLLPNIMTSEQRKKLENHKTHIVNLLNEFLKQKKQQKQGQIKETQNKQAETKQTFNCTWQYILQNLSSYQQKHEQSQLTKTISNNNSQKKDLSKKDQSRQQINQKCKIEIKNFVNQLNTNQKKNCVFIASAIHSLVDVFIDIAANLIQNREKNEFYLKNIGRIQQFIDVLINQRSDLIKRGRFSKSVYIPIKTGMSFSSILKFKNWVMMLQESESAHQSTIQAVFHLLRFIIDIRQTMTEIRVHLSSDLLKSIIQSKNPKNNIENKSKANQEFPFFTLLASVSENENLRKWFWQLFFVITNKIILLIKRFYSRTTAYHFTSKIKINQQDFALILQNFKEYIPPLHQQTTQKTVKAQNLSPMKPIQQIQSV